MSETSEEDKDKIEEQKNDELKPGNQKTTNNSSTA